MMIYFLIDPVQSINDIRDLVLPVITDATNWSMSVSLKLIALYAFYTLLIRVFR